jgi:CheY-like chemotaxis protein
MNQTAVLYVEDEENDVLFMQMAFAEAGIRHPLQIATNGQEAISYLSGTGGFTDRRQFPLPGLVLLDLNLPRVSGFKVLDWIRHQRQFSTLPVVVYTSSDQPTDQERARQLQATDFVVKRSTLTEVAVVVAEVVARYLSPEK